MLSFRPNLRHWLHRNAKLLVPVKKISSIWRHFVSVLAQPMCSHHTKNAVPIIPSPKWYHTCQVTLDIPGSPINLQWQVCIMEQRFNKPWLTGDLRKMTAILQDTFSNAFSWMKIFEFVIKFQWTLSQRVQLIRSQNWFKKCPRMKVFEFAFKF